MNIYETSPKWTFHALYSINSNCDSEIQFNSQLTTSNRTNVTIELFTKDNSYFSWTLRNRLQYFVYLDSIIYMQLSLWILSETSSKFAFHVLFSIQFKNFVWGLRNTVLLLTNYSEWALLSQFDHWQSTLPCLSLYLKWEIRGSDLTLELNYSEMSFFRT